MARKTGKGGKFRNVHSRTWQSAAIKEMTMKIALIMENSQAQKNASVENALKKAVLPYGYEVVNYGMFNEKDDPLTYVQNGILAAILLNSKTADYVVTGCGTG